VQSHPHRAIEDIATLVTERVVGQLAKKTYAFTFVSPGCFGPTFSPKATRQLPPPDI